MFYIFYVLPIVICIISTFLIYLRLKESNIKFKLDTESKEYYGNIRYFILICTPLINLMLAATFFYVALIMDKKEFEKVFNKFKDNE